MAKLLDLPDKFTALRPHQLIAISQIQSHFKNGKKYVFLNAPTGSGKTVIAEYIRQLNNWRGIYTCTTKSLQDQFSRDFDYAKLLKGRNNYPTELNPNIAADECRDQITPGSCQFCPTACGYKVARDAAGFSDIPVLNLDYLLLVCNGNSDAFRGRDLCIIDECDELESKLLGYVGFTLTDRQLREYDINRPSVKTHTAKHAYEDWQQWAETAAIKVLKYRDGIDRENNLKKWLAVNRLLYKIFNLTKSFVEDTETGKIHSHWIYCYDTKSDNSSVTFKPIHVKDDAKDLLFNSQDRFLLMSATIIAPDVMAEDFGIDRSEYAVVDIPSTFPKENRPIYPIAAGSMAWKKRKENTPNIVRAIRSVLERHPHERIIIHTHTGYLAKEVYADLKQHFFSREIVTYTSGRDREYALDRYKKKEGSVLVAMSMARGIDLPGDLCEVQVICVLPRMPINDQQISARMYSKGGNAWYSVFTIRELVQATGRGVRNKEDKATTYIMDSQFIDFYRRNERMFPKWWSESIDWSGKTSREILEV